MPVQEHASSGVATACRGWGAPLRPLVEWWFPATGGKVRAPTRGRQQTLEIGFYAHPCPCMAPKWSHFQGKGCACEGEE